MPIGSQLSSKLNGIWETNTNKIDVACDSINSDIVEKHKHVCLCF
jgi:hypothetical protein